MTTDAFAIGKQLGAILEKQIAIDEKLDAVIARQDATERELRETVRPRLAELMAFKGHVGKAVIAAGAVAMSAFGLVWQGITHYWSDIVGLVGRLIPRA
jgi:hypothetical protein